MGCGLEARPPFLDNEMVEFALGLESHFKLKGKTTKYLLKRAASLEKWVPEDILQRKKKGFSVPISRWIRRELESKMMDHLETSELFNLGILERNRFREIFKEHLAMRKDWGKTLWSFLVLDFWFRQNCTLLKT
jgi:asparagine synthase (glutamine-hydrolysing)